jgi:DNA polymerase III delta subunit
MLEVLTGTDDFSKYEYCRNFAKKEKKQFKFFKSKDWNEFEGFLPSLVKRSLFSTDYCCYCDFHEGLSKKKLDVILELSEIIEDSETNALFIGSEKSLKGLKKSKQVFQLPKPWKDNEWKELVRSHGIKMGLDLTDEQINRLVYDTGPDMWRIHNELRKFIDLSEGNKIDDDTFTDLFYSYTKEDLQNFICDFANRTSAKALNKLDEILSENNPIQIIYRLSLFYTLIFKIKLLSSKKYFTFNDVRALATKTQTNIPMISQIVGFSFKKNEYKENIAAQYTLDEVEQFLFDILFLEIDYKSGKKDFRAQLIGFFQKTRR